VWYSVTVNMWIYHLAKECKSYAINFSFSNKENYFFLWNTYKFLNLYKHPTKKKKLSQLANCLTVIQEKKWVPRVKRCAHINPLNAELNSICHLLALLGAHHIFHVSGLRVKFIDMFKVCKFVHYHTIQINQPTRCNNLSSLLLGVYLQLNMIRASSHPSAGAQQLQ
jgi:hypothetical protein